MAFTPVAGSNAKIVFVTNGSNSNWAAINWSLGIDPKAKDVSNFRDGRFRCKTLTDTTLTFTVIHDAAAPEYLASNGALIDGQVGTAYCYTNSTNSATAYVVPFMITNLGVKNEGVEGVVMMDCTAMQHNGTITYPTA